MTWRRGALILSVYLALATALTGAVLHVATGGRPVPADLVPRPEQRATVELRTGAPARGQPAENGLSTGSRVGVAPGAVRDARPLPLNRGDRGSTGAATAPRRAVPRPSSPPNGPTPSPGSAPVPAPAPGPPPALTPVSDPMTAAAPTTTLRSVEGTGRSGSTQQLLLDFAVDEPSVPGGGTERSVRLPMSMTPPEDATALRFDVVIDLAAQASAHVTVAPVRDAPSRPTVERGEAGAHSIVVPLPLNGVLAPVEAAAGPFAAAPATIKVPFAAT